MHVESKIPESTLRVLEGATKYRDPEDEGATAARFVNPLGYDPNPPDYGTELSYVKNWGVESHTLLLWLITLLLAVNMVLLLLPYFGVMPHSSRIEANDISPSTRPVVLPVSEDDLLLLVGEHN